MQFSTKTLWIIIIVLVLILIYVSYQYRKATREIKYIRAMEYETGIAMNEMSQCGWTKECAANVRNKYPHNYIIQRALTW